VLQVASSVHDHFLEGVAARCNSVIQPPSSHWRNEYYTADLNLILNLNAERRGHVSFRRDYRSDALAAKLSPSDDPQGLLESSSTSCFGTTSDLSGTHLDRSIEWNQPLGFTPTSDLTGADPLDSSITWNEPFYSGSSFMSGEFGSSVTATSSSAFTRTLSIDPIASSVISLNTTSRSSRYTFPSPSTISTAPSTRLTCEFCPGRIFRGTLQSQRRSLRRHRFTMHGVDRRLSCPFPGCNDTFSRGRIDNMKRHMERQHSMASLPVEPRCRRRRETGGV